MDTENINKTKWMPPLLCWDIVAMYLAEMTALGDSQSDLLNLLEYQKRFSWHTDLSHILNSSYDALVLTDSSIKIEWVNQGFYHMTGYVKNEAIGKKPNFLQGKNTSEISKRRIREQLLGVNAFSETLINYRPDNYRERRGICVLRRNSSFVHQRKQALALFST